MIAQFVDDLLVAIREATVDELREFFAQNPGGMPLLEPTSLDASAALANTLRSARVGHPNYGAELRRSIESSLSSAPPPAIAEITDPESLLSLGNPNGSSESFSDNLRSSTSAPPDEPRPVLSLLHRRWAAANHGSEPEIDSPASSIRPVSGGSTVRLSDNETFARVSSSGVVIRRKKKS